MNKIYKISSLVIVAIFTVVSVAWPVPVAAVDRDFMQLNDVLFYDPDALPLGCDDTTSISREANIQNIEQFIDAYGQLAFNVGKSYAIPYEAIIAQAYLESGRGNSTLTREANNFFGIKTGTSWDGAVYSINTEEERPDGSRYTVRAAFRSYPTPQAGFYGYGDFIHSGSRYDEALKYPSDPARYIEELKNAGYATDSNYVNSNVSVQEDVIAYISENDLFPPSSEVDHDTEPPQRHATSSVDCLPASTPEAIARVIQIAERELAKSPVEYDDNVMRYTTNRTEHWCADFVSYIFKEAGIPFTGGPYHDWQIPSVIAMRDWFKQGVRNSEYFAVGQKTPMPGDVAIYLNGQTLDTSSTNHINIVVSVDGDTMTTIGGNESDTVRKTTRQIELGANSLVGFGRMR